MYAPLNIPFTLLEFLHNIDDLDLPDLSDLFREVTPDPDPQPPHSLINVAARHPIRLSLATPSDPGPSRLTAPTAGQQLTGAHDLPSALPHGSFGSASISSVPSLPPGLPPLHLNSPPAPPSEIEFNLPTSPMSTSQCTRGPN